MGFVLLIIHDESESSSGHSQEHCHSHFSFFHRKNLRGQGVCAQVIAPFTTFFEDEFDSKTIDVKCMFLGVDGSVSLLQAGLGEIPTDCCLICRPNLSACHS